MHLCYLYAAWYSVIFVVGWKVTSRSILASKSSFIAAGLKGNDMGRDPRPEVRAYNNKISLKIEVIIKLGCRVIGIDIRS